MKKFDIMTLGVPMVEFIREEKDRPLSVASKFYGPIPAGDPGIALNACVKLGFRGCYVGVLGKDAMADCFLRQMHDSGINTDWLRVHDSLLTGMSILGKNSDGSREFIFTVPFSAAATIGLQDLDKKLLKNVRWIHLSGFAMSISDSSAMLHNELIREAGEDVRISFDPNFRSEVISKNEYVFRCKEVLQRCDYFLPSRGEAAIFSDDPSQSDEDFCKDLSMKGKEVVLKDGAKGTYAFSKGEGHYYPPYPVTEVDGTGAGDTFDGALIAATMQGSNLFEATGYAAAAGALAVTRYGLMEIAPVWEDIYALMKKHSNADER
ncbi:MAG: sugar kinase [Clostridiales bacterium]|nr:sugar kinase [Clostridiales bacterium]